MLKVLVTNDDGIEALGLRVLVEALAEHADVYVVAPQEQQSAKSQSITFLREVSAEERELKGAVAAWTLDGTPTDCIMWGIGMLAEEGIRPDFVFSGINMGYNTGLAAYYSGTIAGAREGALNGIRSIALSVGSHQARFFDYVLGLLPRLMEMSRKISPKTVLSVNAPDIPSWDIRGVRVAEAAPYGYGVRFGFHKAESGNYQMGGAPDFTDDRMRYDFDWICGHIAAPDDAVRPCRADAPQRTNGRDGMPDSHRRCSAADAKAYKESGPLRKEHLQARPCGQPHEHAAPLYGIRRAGRTLA